MKRKLHEKIEDIKVVNNIDNQDIDPVTKSVAPISFVDAVMQTRKKNSTVGKMFTKKSTEAKDALKKEISNDEHVEPLDEINVKEDNMLILDENLFEDYGVQERHSMNEDTEDDERVKTFKLNGIIYKISKLEDSLGNGGYVARWEDDSDNGLGYNNRGWISFDKKSYVLHNEASKPIKDFMYVISAYDRQPKQSAADKLIATTISMFGDDAVDTDSAEINEDTVKTKDGKWANVGKDEKVDSGKFKTKKEADAQRRAMFANGYKGESLEEDDIDEIETSEQEYTSANTSINSTKLPAIFSMVRFEPETINLDYGGGKFDNATAALEGKGVTNLVYDPYNRSSGHNKDVIDTIRKNGGADTATCSNVLNVIKEPAARTLVIKNIYKLLKPNGVAYFTVYEGTGKGDEGPTKAGYQLNKKTADYVEEISSVFPSVSRRGKLIIASKGTSITEEFDDESLKESDDSQFDKAVEAMKAYWNYQMSLEQLHNTLLKIYNNDVEKAFKVFAEYGDAARRTKDECLNCDPNFQVKNESLKESVYRVTYTVAPNIYSSVMIKAKNEEDAKQRFAEHKVGKEIAGVKEMADYEVDDMLRRGMSLISEAYGDGWPDEIIDDKLFRTLDQFLYEIRMARRGAYTACKTFKELAEYVRVLSSRMDEYADSLEDMEEDTDIDESIEEDPDEEDIVKMDFYNYKPWGNAERVYGIIKGAGKLGALEQLIDEMYPEGLNETELNDILTFESDWVADMLGIPELKDDEE